MKYLCHIFDVLRIFAHQSFCFLSGASFAIFLLSITALTIIIGTFLESFYDSHRFAEQYIYHSLFFKVLLVLFFINILFSALHRWPFKRHHFPFLLTHLGLLMIISGTILKTLFGIQGNMEIIEGSGSNEITIPYSEALKISYQNRQKSIQIPICTNLSGKKYLSQTVLFEKLHLHLINYLSHSEERYECGFYENFFFAYGSEPIPIGKKKKIVLDSYTNWDIIALNSEEPLYEIRKLLLEGLTVKLTLRKDPQYNIEFPYEYSIDSPISLPEGEVQVLLVWDKLVDSPSLLVTFNPLKGPQEKIWVPLEGSAALLPKEKTYLSLFLTNYDIDLSHPSVLIFLKTRDLTTILCAIDQTGTIHRENFIPDPLSTIIVYDEGFGGYGKRFTLPSLLGISRKEKEDLCTKALLNELSALKKEQLNPSLQLCYESCQNASLNFPHAFLDLLCYWDHTGEWIPQIDLLPPWLEKFIQLFPWEKLTKHEQKALYWTSKILLHIQDHVKNGMTFFEVLQKYQWPFLNAFTSDNNDIDNMDYIKKLTRQIISIAEHLPSPFNSTEDLNTNDRFQRICAYLLMEGIHLKNFSPNSHVEKKQTSFIDIPLFPYHQESSSKKMEENTPKLLLRLQSEHSDEIKSLVYDPTGKKMAWPLRDRNWLVHFQPQWIECPYRIRLRKAKQINYSNSSLPFSFEASLLITDLKRKIVFEKIIAMNNVYETWDGFRFYLANISKDSPKKILLVVNYDPYKYILTYPGGILVAIGILLLLWVKKI